MHVLIIGAGVSGLAAARELKKANIPFTILEGRGRIGGRVLTKKSKPFPMDLGPEFLHGATPLTDALIEEFSGTAIELEYQYMIFENGKLREKDGYWEALGRLLRKIPKQKPDQAFAKFLKHSKWNKSQQKMAGAFMEGFNAIDLERGSTNAIRELSAQADDDDERRLRHLLESYGKLVDHLAGGLKKHIALRHIVKEIRWNKDGAKVSGVTEKKTPFRMTGTHVLITVPTGVLNANPKNSKAGLRFLPHPAGLKNLQSQLGMGSVAKVMIETKPDLLQNFKNQIFPFVASPDLHFSAWWGMGPVHTPWIAAWAGGSRARTLNRLKPKARELIVIKDLAKITGLSETATRKSIKKLSFHNWEFDPFSLGAYAFSVVATPKSAPKQTVYKNVLFFAGEAFSEKKSGTVEGALQTGVAAAKKILHSVRNGIAPKERNGKK